MKLALYYLWIATYGTVVVSALVAGLAVAITLFSLEVWSIYHSIIHWRDLAATCDWCKARHQQKNCSASVPSP